jgi:hypothetical protein
MTVSEQIQFVEMFELNYLGDTRKALSEVKESLRHLNAIYTEIAPKYELYNQFVASYHNFVVDHVPLFVFTAREGKQLKEIIAKLIKVKGGGSEEHALMLWRAILSNWGKLNVFMQSQKQLTQINKYLVEIIDQLKNGHYQNKQQFTAKQTAENAQSVIDRRRQERGDSN